MMKKAKIVTAFLSMMTLCPLCIPDEALAVSNSWWAEGDFAWFIMDEYAPDAPGELGGGLCSGSGSECDDYFEDLHEDLIEGRAYALYHAGFLNFVVYGERDYGINLVWESPAGFSPPREFRFKARGVRRGAVLSPRFLSPTRSSSIMRIAYYENLAIKNDTGGYICYGEREYGINLVWSDRPCYEWTILQGCDRWGDDLGQCPSTQRQTVLYNQTARNSVGYHRRDYGINLGWGN